MAALHDDGIEIVAHDPAITADTRIESQLAYVRHAAQGLGRLAGSLRAMLRPCPQSAVAEAEAVIVTHANDLYRATVAPLAKPVIDVARLFKARATQPNCISGIGW